VIEVLFTHYEDEDAHLLVYLISFPDTPPSPAVRSSRTG